MKDFVTWQTSVKQDFTIIIFKRVNAKFVSYCLSLGK